MSAVMAEIERVSDAVHRLFRGEIEQGFNFRKKAHAYTTETGELHYVKVRLYNKAGDDKRIKPMRPGSNGRFSLGEPPFPNGKPLYRLKDISERKDEPVIVTEGELNADDLANLGLLTTTSGGADSAAKTYWHPLAGRRVIIWPDFDDAGQRYAEAVGEILICLKCSVSIIDAAALGLKVKGDASDWLAGHTDATAADVLALPTIPAASKNQGASWPALDPLPELHDAEPEAFPFDGLGPILGPAAREIADAVQAPDALAAGSVLAAAAVAVQPIADIKFGPGLKAPLSLFVITSAGSGDRKSAVDSVAGAPIEERRKRDARAFAEAMVAHRARLANAKRGGAETDPPVVTASIVSKGTTEGLHHLLRTQSSVGLFSTEGAELLGGHSMREERRSAAIAWLLKAWGGETLDNLTRGDGLSVLVGRRVSLHVLLQPVILQKLLTDPLAQGQGWIARCLIAAPTSLAGTRLFRHGAQPAAERGAVHAYHERLKALLATALSVADGGDGRELAPRVLELTTEAHALWCEFYDECERKQAKGGPLEGVQPWASKAAEHAARIAGILTVVEDENAASVSEATMAGAIEVTSFYLSEHLRLSGASRDQHRHRQLAALLSWLQQRNDGAAVTHSDVLQSTPRPLRELKASGLLPLLTELTTRGYIRRVAEQWEVRP